MRDSGAALKTEIPRQGFSRWWWMNPSKQGLRCGLHERESLRHIDRPGLEGLWADTRKTWHSALQLFHFLYEQLNHRSTLTSTSSLKLCGSASHCVDGCRESHRKPGNVFRRVTKQTARDCRGTGQIQCHLGHVRQQNTTWQR